ncbi:hypothetical protein FE257_000937 [Aspergillus nanangensis]|uniref:Nephrocystin 3-like N-terminal domain-containing protein n=1 Tax=Aspergillus nanangensis TaxID=2582783 RepID=A0AAD4CE80_ASPNN|nr:hypothetical protein FE257_000937 [Aspergillus nanangensis]
MAKRRRLSPQDYAVGWVCALAIELAAAEEILDETHEDLDYGANSIYTLGRVGEHNVVIACLPKGQMGTNSAATAAAQLKSVFPSVSFGILVGIGGEVPSVDADVRLGDVVVSQPRKLHGGVVQYDFGKSTPSGIERTGFLNAPPKILLEAVAKLQASHLRGRTKFHEYISRFNSLPTFSSPNHQPDGLFDANYQHLGGSTCENCSNERLMTRVMRNEGVVIHYATTKERPTEEYLKKQKAIEETLSRLPYAVDASFNSYQRQHEPTCLVDTQVQVLEEISSWANGENGCSIFWLNGWAGTGKSTIARTIARKYYNEQRLGASFFFSRGGGDVGHSGKFVTSLARQLAMNVLPLQPSICEAAAACLDIGAQSLTDQWRQLVLGPLSKLSIRSGLPSYIIVIDALDECDDDRSIRIILQLLTEAQSVSKNLLRVFVTSRPNLPINHGFSQIPEPNRCTIILHHISSETLGHDITIFLKHELLVIAQEQGLGELWPGTDAINHLAESAGGLFIWCATASRFIYEGGLFAEDRLNTLLQDIPSGTAPEERLDEIYLSVLRSSVQTTYTEQEKERFFDLLRELLGVFVTLFSPLSLGSICKLLQVPRRKTDSMLMHLHAILDIPDDMDRPLRLHHPSFRDFLLDTHRCKDSRFCVNEQSANYELAQRCLKLMDSVLRQDICRVNSPGTSTDEVDETQVQRHISLEAQYACLFWVQHFTRSGALLKDDDLIHLFLSKHILHWLEALSGMRRLSEGLLAILSLEITTALNYPS